VLNRELHDLTPEKNGNSTLGSAHIRGGLAGFVAVKIIRDNLFLQLSGQLSSFHTVQRIRGICEAQNALVISEELE
jgi:hypothetical protein